MKVFLLSGGYGKRLRPITNTVPKCLVKINGEPLLEFWLKKLKDIGCGPILINTHYMHNQVEAFIKKFNLKQNINVKITYEKKLLGTAGTIVNNLDFLDKNDKNFMIIHADNYTHDDLKKFKTAHENRPKNCLMSMMIFKTKTPQNCGIVQLDENNVLINMHEKVSNPPGNLANGAIYILSNEMIKILKNNFFNAKDFTNEIVMNLFGKIFCYETKEFFIDIGTEVNYIKANKINKL